MGKGDRKTRRGKLWRGSHGKRRPKKEIKSVIPDKSKEEPKKSKPKRRTQKKQEA